MAAITSRIQVFATFHVPTVHPVMAAEMVTRRGSAIAANTRSACLGSGDRQTASTVPREHLGEIVREVGDVLSAESPIPLQSDCGTTSARWPCTAAI